MSNRIEFADSPAWAEAQANRNASWDAHEAWLAKTQADRDAILAKRTAADAWALREAQKRSDAYNAALKSYYAAKSARPFDSLAGMFPYHDMPLDTLAAIRVRCDQIAGVSA